MKKYIFIALLGLYSCSEEQGITDVNAPKASFTTDKEEYTVGDNVILTNTSEATVNKIVSYFWHFGFDGNGNRSEDENTSVTYSKAGKYAVKLTVTDEQGLYSTYCDTIVVSPTNMAPVADFNYTPLLCKINEKVSFTSTAYDEDGTIDSYQWIINEQEVANEKDFDYTFDQGGFVKVSLIVKDNKGEISKKEATIYVRGNVSDSYTRLWTKEFESSSSLRSISPAVGDNGDIYISSNALHLYAYSVTGEQKWMFDLSKNGESGNQGSSPMVDNDGTIYIGAHTDDGNLSSSLYAINPDGTMKWRYELGTGTTIPYLSPVKCPDGNIVIGNRGTNGSVHKVDVLNGTQIWRTKSPNGGANAGLAVDAMGVIYCGLSSANGFSRTTTDGKNLSPNLGKGYTAGATLPAIDSDGNIYVAFSEGIIASYSPDGVENWSYSIGSKVDQGGPVIDKNGNIYVGTKGNEILSLTKNGSKRWSYTNSAPLSGVPAIDSKGRLHIGDEAGNYIVLDIENGNELHKETLGTKVWSSPVISDFGIIFIAFEDNGACKLTAIDCGIEGPARSAWPQRGQNAKRNGLQK